MRAENEGYGFVRKENVDFFFYSGILFLCDTLGVDERGWLRLLVLGSRSRSLMFSVSRRNRMAE